MENIPTAVDFWMQNQMKFGGSIERGLQEFAKLHVKAALEAASNNTVIKDIKVPNCDDHTPYWGACVSCGRYDNPDVLVGHQVDKESILNSYPEQNIK